MGNILGALVNHNKETEILLMAWADHHPYLFTMIEIAAPINWVVVAIVGMKVIGTMVGATKHGRR